MGSKGSNTTTNQTQSTPDPNAYAAYLSLLNRASGVAATPYQAYTGEGVAGVNPQEMAGITGTNTFAQAAQPSVQSGLNQIATAGAPLTAQTIQSYMNPYTQNVVNATQAEFNNQNQQALQNIRGNAIAQGALGGNREGVAEGVASGQQTLAQAPVIAGLYNTGYGQAVNTAMGEQGLGIQAGQATGNLGIAGQTSGLQGAGAQIGAGQLQQNTQQALDTYLAQQYAQQQAYPYQQTQWLAGLDTGVGSQMGGTSQGQTTGPPPNPWSQIAGGITSGVGALGATGAFGSAGWLMPAFAALKRGGRVHGVAYEPAPENVHTLAAQQKQLTDGHRVAQLYPKGHPELRLPKGMSRAKMPNGDIFHYDPKRITKELLIHASKTGQENHVLGLGPVSKHEAIHRFAQGEHPVAVVERNGVGTEVRTAAGTHGTAGVQFHHMDAHKSPGHYVSIERPDHTIAARAAGGGIGYDSGGGVAGIPWAGAPSWIPQNSIVHGSGAPRASAPGVANTGSSDLSKQASQIGQLATQISNANNNAYGPTVAGTTPEADAMNDFLQDTAAGDAGSASTYGLARGGVAGFDDGGGVVPDFDERFPLIKDEGQGTTSIGSPDDYPVGSRFNPYRDVSPDSTQSWRQGVDQPNAAVAADVPESGSSGDLPVSRGVAPSRMAFSGDTSGAPPADLPDEVALGYSGHKSDGVSPPTTDSSSPSSGIDWSSSGKLWPALMSAGFGMLASRSPFFGVAVGEGGQAGLGTYGAEQQREFEAQKYAQQMEHQQREEARLEQQARVSQANQPLLVDEKGNITQNKPYIAAKQQLERDWQPKLVPSIGTNYRGDPVPGIYDPNTKKSFFTDGTPAVVDQNGIVRPATPQGTAPPPAATPPAPQSQNVPPQTTPPSNAPASFGDRFGSAMPSSPANATAAANTPTPYQVASLGLVPPSHQMPSSAVPFDPNKPTPPATMDNPNTPTPPPPPPPEPPPHKADPNAPEGTEASRDTAFISELKKQDPGYAAEVKKAADYQLDPGKVFSLQKNRREHFLRDVLQYDPNYNPNDVALRFQAQKAFLPGTKTGDTVRAFNTAVSHLDTLRAAYKAVQNGDIQAFNAIKNRFQAEFGYSPPNTLNAISQIVGGEVVKATVGAQNALGDREELRKALESKLSQGQALDVIDHFQQLMGGQLHSLRFAYEQSTHLHDFDEKYLLPRSREVLKHVDAEMAKEGKTTGPQTEQDQKALDWANSNPNDPRAAAIKKKLGIQ